MKKEASANLRPPGPIKLGTAFVDQGRCLPWSMDKPCIVCQENCPVSPKAIFTKDVFSTVRDGVVSIKKVTENTIEIDRGIPADKFATGDYYVLFEDGSRCKISSNTATSIGIVERANAAVSRQGAVKSKFRCDCKGLLWILKNVSAAAYASTNAPSAVKGR